MSAWRSGSNNTICSDYKIVGRARWQQPACFVTAVSEESSMRQPITMLVAAASAAAALRLPAPHSATTRRQVLAGAASLAAYLPFDHAASAATGATSGAPRTDEKMDAARKAASTPEAARALIVEGYKALGELLDEFDTVTANEGGDGIRRVLGTVGTTSPVYLIEPAFRMLFEKDENLPCVVAS